MNTKFFLLAVITFILSVILLSCNKEKVFHEKIKSKEGLPEIEVKNVELMYSDSGLVKMKLFAPSLVDFTEIDEPYTEFSKGVLVYFYDRFKNIESSLASGYAHHTTNEDIWNYKEHVKVVNKQGDTLITEQLTADREKERIYSDTLVTIKSKEGSVITGKDGFVSNLEFTEYTFETVIGVGSE